MKEGRRAVARACPSLAGALGSHTMSPMAVVAAALLGLIGPESASDVVTLRDGKAVRGEVVEPSTRGVVTVLVRRFWARANLPEWAERWEAAEAPAVKRATAQRRER